MKQDIMEQGEIVRPEQPALSRGRTTAPIVLLLLALAGLAFIGRSFFDQLGCEGQVLNQLLIRPGGQEIWGERLIGQSFTATRPNLHRLDLMLHPSGQNLSHEVVLRLLELPPGSVDLLTGRQVARLNFAAAGVRTNVWHTVTFPPLPDSASKEYTFFLQAPEAEPGRALMPGGMTWNVYTGGSAFFGSTPVPDADLAFRACYLLSPMEKLQLLAGRLTRYRPALWASPAFYLLLGLLYLALVAALFWKLVALIRDR